MEEPFTWSGIGTLTHKQALTLTKIIVWASTHEDCDVTQDEAKELCKSIQYISITRPEEEAEE